MLYGQNTDTVHDGSLMTWDPLVWIHEERNNKKKTVEDNSEVSYYCLYCVFYFYNVYFDV